MIYLFLSILSFDLLDNPKNLHCLMKIIYIEKSLLKQGF